MSYFEDRFQGVWSATYMKNLAVLVAMFLVLLGAVHCFCMGAFETSLLQTIFGSFSSVIFILIGIAGLALLFQRNTYLPFLGPMVAPCSVLENKEPPGATKAITILAEPNTKIIYWAAEPAMEHLKSINSWKEAYGKYDNAGVATANADGVAVIKVRDPQGYKVPFKGRIDSHVHYRTCGEAGWMGEVKTLFVNPHGPEGFDSQPATNTYRVINLADSAASIY